MQPCLTAFYYQVDVFSRKMKYNLYSATITPSAAPPSSGTTAPSPVHDPPVMLSNAHHTSAKQCRPPTPHTVHSCAASTAWVVLVGVSGRVNYLIGRIPVYSSPARKSDRSSLFITINIGPSVLSLRLEISRYSSLILMLCNSTPVPNSAQRGQRRIYIMGVGGCAVFTDHSERRN